MPNRIRELEAENALLKEQINELIRDTAAVVRGRGNGHKEDKDLRAKRSAVRAFLRSTEPENIRVMIVYGPDTMTPEGLLLRTDSLSLSIGLSEIFRILLW